MGAMRSAAVLNELVDSRSERVRLEAAKYSLATAGIKPASDPVSVTIGQIAGYVIDLSGRDPGETRVKVVEHEAGVVIDANPEPIAGVGPCAKPID